METNQYLTMFIDESRDHLQKLNENLLLLEQNPQDISIVQEIFRSAHTLKGMSATMGFEDIASLTHQMENVLDAVRNHKLAMNEAICDTLFKGLDSLESMVEDIIAGGTGKADVTAVVGALTAVMSGESPAAATPGKGGAIDAELTLDEYQFSVIQQSLGTGHKAFHIKVAIREDCVLKAARAYMVFDYLERHGEVVKSSPSVQDIEQEKFEKHFVVYYITKLRQNELEEQISGISEIESVAVTAIDIDSLAEMNRAAKSKQAEAKTNEQAERQNAPSAPAAGQARGQVQVNRTIRVDIERLDTLMNLFSELLIDRVRLEVLASEVKRPELSDTVEHMARVSTDLQNIVLKLRMVPVDTVFNRFPRMIRDLAKQLDKKVDLVISGADTELDRTVIDEIGDPLVHMLRNSLDHGVEPVADRVAAGKSETGTIQLRAFHSGNHVFIEIEDDGRGINREKVKQVAIKNGVITPEEAKKMSDSEADHLLFASGFSTADKISDISGRGVGLDVVKSKITSLGGNVTVESRPGFGTKFSVQLPLTLSIISAMLIRAADEKYAIPLSSILETAIVRPEQIRDLHGREVIDFRGNIIPVLALGELFDSPGYSRAGKAELDLVIIKKGEKLAAIIVDEFIGQQEIVLKTLGKYLGNLFAVSGATILGDGQVALIVDPNGIIK